MSGDSRKDYWNEAYLAYWKSRVDEAGQGKSQVVSGDSNTEDNDVYRRIFDAHGFNPGTLLEVGCAWGRMFPIYLDYGLSVTGADISHAMVDSARKDWLGHEGIANVVETAAEELPFENNTFDNLTCLATLDATFQNRAVTEFLRVTKPGAKIIVTGKNNLYQTDDKEAYRAEVGARRKSHPNFFTDTSRLVDLLTTQGHRVDAMYCFPRRGDFARFNYVSSLSGRFYEFLLVVSRGDSYAKLPSFSDAFSSTFRELEAADE